MTKVGQPQKAAPITGVNIADCCDAATLADLASDAFGPQSVDTTSITISDPSAFVSSDKDGVDHLHLLVENLHCAACIGKIEGYLKAQPDVVEARVNMSTRRLSVSWVHGKADPGELMRGVAALGYPVAPFDPADVAKSTDVEDKRLLSALAVSGFAAGNVMLLSVSI
jgi:Cu2+-exporting ATPase